MHEGQRKGTVPELPLPPGPFCVCGYASSPKPHSPWSQDCFPYDAWFSSWDRRHNWTERLISYNRSAHLSDWRDFERCFARWIESSGNREAIRLAAELDVERVERAELDRLLAKYPDVRQRIYEEIA